MVFRLFCSVFEAYLAACSVIFDCVILLHFCSFLGHGNPKPGNEQLICSTLPLLTRFVGWKETSFDEFFVIVEVNVDWLPTGSLMGGQHTVTAMLTANAMSRLKANTRMSSPHVTGVSPMKVPWCLFHINNLNSFIHSASHPQCFVFLLFTLKSPLTHSPKASIPGKKLQKREASRNSGIERHPGKITQNFGKLWQDLAFPDFFTGPFSQIISATTYLFREKHGRKS